MSAPTPAAPPATCPLCGMVFRHIGWVHQPTDCAQIAEQARLITERDAEIARLRAQVERAMIRSNPYLAP